MFRIANNNNNKTTIVGKLRFINFRIIFLKKKKIRYYPFFFR